MTATTEKTPVAPPIPPMPDIKLTDLKWIRAANGYGSVRKNRSTTDKALKLDGKIYENGLGAHANSDIRYNIPPGARRFRI